MSTARRAPRLAELFHSSTEPRGPLPPEDPPFKVWLIRALLCILKASDQTRHFSEAPVMPVIIPPRDESKYAWQYSEVIDLRRVVEIFSDSYKIAFTSKKPDTAHDRFDLALEAFYQIMSMQPPASVRDPVQDAMEELAQYFPIQVLINEAEGLREKAMKLKTPKKRAERLLEAKALARRAITRDSKCAPAHALANQIDTEIANIETGNMRQG